MDQESLHYIADFITALEIDSRRWMKSFSERLDLLERKYNPDQPRVPAGEPGAGEWTSGGDGSDSGTDNNSNQGDNGYDPFSPNTDDSIDESYGLEALGGGLLALGGVAAGAIGEGIAALSEGAAELGESATAVSESAAESEATDWTLGDFKSPTTWENQMSSRGWTSEDITETIENGEQFSAPNKINPGNSATRYQNSDGSYVVKDDITNEILQISGRNFEPNQ